jgi:hypothetical protein
MRPSLVVLSALLVFSSSPLLAQQQPAHSGFLESYPAMQPDTKRPGAFIYVAPGATLKGYHKVALAPILVWYAKDSPYQGINPEDLAGVTKNFRAALVKNLEPKYPVVDTTGPDVLQLRIAITQVYAEKKKRGILGYTPVGFVVGAAKDMATAGPNVNLNSATIEAELLDPSGKQIAVSMDPLVIDADKREKLTFAQIADILDAAGKRIRARMDADNPP